MKKRLLSLCLAMLMIFGMLPISVSAAESYLWPVDNVYSMSRGYYTGHNGIDIWSSSISGKEVRATKSGTIIESSNSCPHISSGDNRCNCNGGCGNFVKIQHDDGTYSRYLHFQQGTAHAKGRVNQGDVIGKVGSSGDSSGYHLHFEIFNTSNTRINSNPTDSRHTYHGSHDAGSISYIYELSYTITFNANGGSCTTGSKTVTPGSAIGTLPTASMSGHDFVGWTTSTKSAGDLVTSSTVFSENTTLYAHYADRLYTGNHITFDANGGTLPEAKDSAVLNGFNIGRSSDYLVVYNCGGETVGTNYYGSEVVIDSTGRAVKIRAYGNTEELTVPEGGFVLSGHTGGTANVFVNGIEIGDYVAYDQDSMIVYVYDSEEAYHTHHKYLDTDDNYGTLPIPSGPDDFRGWFTHPEEGQQVTEDSTYIASKLYAHWGCSHNFIEEIIPATCEDFEKICYTCKDCGYTYTEYTAAIFSEWSTTRPTGVDESLIETKTQYRYRDYETTTSYEPSLSGWTRTGSSWEESGNGSIQYVKSWPSGFSTSHGLYSQYNKSPKSASESDTDRTTINSDRVTGYLYYHWCRGTYTGGPINRTTKPSKEGEFSSFHAFYSTTSPSSLEADDDGSVIYSNGNCCTDSYWYFYVPVYTQSYSTYRNLFSYERWSAWSEWSDTEYTASDTREVETRTMYRYAEGASAWSDKYPEDTGSGIVQTKNQYRYSDQKTITSYEPTISGYTVIGSSWQQSGSGNVQYVKSWPSGFATSHSLYAQYNQSPRSASESDTDKTVINSDQVTGYLYYHWCRGTYTDGPINRGSKSTQQGEFNAFHAFYSTTNPATLTQPNDRDGSYQHGNADCCRDSYWYFCVPVYTQSYTTYRNLFTHATWTPWSDWSDTVYTSSSTRKVETRTMYRTITSELGEHVWNEGRVVTEATCTAEGLKSYTCTVCGATKSEVLAKLEHRYEDGYCGSCGAVDPEYIFIPAIITAGSISAYPGDTVTIPVTISENPGFAGFTFVIRYDTEAMTLSNISKGDILLSSESGSFTKNTSGATINWTDYQNITSDGELLELTFIISDDAVVGAYDISLERKENDATNFVNEKSQAVSAEFVGGQITVSVRNTKIASGYSGDTSWVLTEDGVMTFSGAGKMKNYDYGADRPWDDYAEQITSVVVEEGITRVGNCAFMGITTLESVTLPESLTHMGEAAFYGTGLYSVDIPAALWTIQPYTFKNCANLTTVIFHEGNLEKISDGAFYGTGLMEVVLPDCLKILDTFAFKGCASLTSITIGSGLTELREAVFYGTDISEITIPEGITKIGPYVFKNCVKLETVNMPESLTSVGEASFYACTKLAELDLPDAVTAIGDYAFRKCTSLTSVDFSSSLVTIGESSFYGCSSITGLIIPRGVTTIKGYAFKGCTDLEYVSLPNTLTTIGESAFHSCTGLSEITVPAKVSSIGAYCFSGSTGIKSFEFLGDAPTIGEGAFNKITATAFYPEGNATWTSDVMQNYGGKITWEAN